MDLRLEHSYFKMRKPTVVLAAITTPWIFNSAGTENIVHAEPMCELPSNVCIQAVFAYSSEYFKQRVSPLCGFVWRTMIGILNIDLRYAFGTVLQYASHAVG